MLQIKKVTVREIQLPLVEPFTISSGTESMRRIALIEIEDHDGFIGWGECVASAYPNYNSEAIDTAWVALKEWVLPLTVGVTFEEPAAIYPLLRTHIRGHEMARASIEMAAWDLWAHRKDVSLSRLLGGKREKVATGISVGIQDTPAILVEKVGGYILEGYKKIKIKIKPGYDIQYVAAVREAYDDSVSIMVDANNAYTLNDLDTLRKLDTYNLLMIEQPLAWDDVIQHAAVQRELKTPICLDESITRVERARDMVALKSGRIINIKPGRVGGFASSIMIHDFAQQHGLPVWCGGMLESGIGRAHNVALASLPNFTLPGDISPSRRYWEQDIVKPEWTMEDGMLTVPVDHAGMGIEVDIDRIDNLTVRCFETLQSVTP